MRCNVSYEILVRFISGLVLRNGFDRLIDVARDDPYLNASVKVDAFLNIGGW